MIFQLSDWFPKLMIWAIIIKFDQIRKNWWRISCAEILEIGKNVFAASSVKKMSRFEEVSPEKIKRIAWNFTKTVILLGLAGYELIITASLVIWISSYPARPRRITVNCILFLGLARLAIRSFFLMVQFQAHAHCLIQINSKIEHSKSGFGSRTGDFSVFRVFEKV